MVHRPLIALLLGIVVAAPAAAQERILSLAEAMDVLDAQSLQLDAAEQSIDQANALRRQALAMIRPTVNLSATYTLRDEEIEFGYPNPYAPLAPYLDTVYQEHGATNPALYDPSVLYATSSEPEVVQYRHDIGATLAVDQSLYNARAMPYIRQARIGVRQAENGVELVRYQLRAAVLDTYFAAVMQQRVAEVSERNVELARIALDAAERELEAGVGTQFDVNRARVELAVAERRQEGARASYASAIRALAGLLDVPADFDVRTPSTVPVAPASVATPTDTPDLLAHDLELERHDERIAEARAQWFPTLFFHAQADVRRESAFGGDAFTWFLQVGASWDLYDGGVRTAQARAREQERIAEELRRERTVSELRTAIDLALLDRQRLAAERASAEVEVELARESVELADAAVELGAGTALDAQFAREQLFLSELALASAEVGLLATEYDLLRLAGGEPWALSGP